MAAPVLAAVYRTLPLFRGRNSLFKRNIFLSGNFQKASSNTFRFSSSSMLKTDTQLIEAAWNDSSNTTHGFLRQNISGTAEIFLENKEISSLSFEDSRNFRETIVKQYPKHERAIDANVLVCCFDNSKLLHFGYIYVCYLLEENLLNLASVRVAAELLFRAHVQPITNVNAQIYGRFLKVIDEQFADFADMMVVSKFFVRLCTDEWQSALNDFRKIDFLRNSKPAVFAAGVICFFHNQPSMGFDILQRFADDEIGRTLPKSVHDSLFDCIRRLSSDSKTRQLSIDALTRFVDVSQVYNLGGLHPNYVDVIKDIVRNWQTYSVSETKIADDGCCENCSEALEKETMSREECTYLEKEIYQKLKGENVYRQTTPFELMQFVKFVDSQKPFDIVVDGLNVAYRYSRTNGPDVRVQKLIVAVDQLKSKGFENILVVVRNHMTKSKKFAELISKAKIFRCKDDSEDDLFVLYAAASSGPNCFLASNDYFAFLYEGNPKLRFLLDRWKRIRLVTWMEKSTDGVHCLKLPLEYKLRLQHSSNGFHLPLISPTKSLIGLPHFTECSWLCIRRKNDI